MSWFFDIWNSFLAFAAGHRLMFGLTAAGVSLAGTIVYSIVAAKNEEVKPSRTTWWIWVMLGVLLTIYYLRVGKNDAFWLSLTSSVGSLAVAVVAVFKDYRSSREQDKSSSGSVWAKIRAALRAGNAKMTWLDKICFIVAGTSIVLFCTDNALVALVVCLVVDAAAFIPTLRNICRTPRSESLVPWSILLVANFVNLLAINNWTVAEALYPMYFVVGCTIVNLLLWFLQVILPRFKKIFDSIETYP
jgi:hypothetical protein